MLCDNFEKKTWTMSFNTIFNSKLNRECAVQLMISLSKHRDIQPIQDPPILLSGFQTGSYEA